MMSPEEEEILLALPGAVMAADAQGRIVFANQPCVDLLAWEDVQHLVGRPITALMPPRMVGQHETGFHRYLKSGRSRLLGKRVRVPAVLGDGREVELDLRIRMFRRPDGTDLIIAAFEAVAAGLGDLDVTVLRLEQELANRDYVLAR